VYKEGIVEGVHSCTTSCSPKWNKIESEQPISVWVTNTKFRDNPIIQTWATSFLQANRNNACGCCDVFYERIEFDR